MADTAEHLVVRPERSGAAWFKDVDGVLTTVKDQDETNLYSVDYTNALNSGENIDTSTWTGEGVTAASPALTGAVASVSITGTDGSVKNTLVTDSTPARTLVYRYRFVSPSTSTIAQTRYQ